MDPTETMNSSEQQGAPQAAEASGEPGAPDAPAAAPGAEPSTHVAAGAQESDRTVGGTRAESGEARTRTLVTPEPAGRELRNAGSGVGARDASETSFADVADGPPKTEPERAPPFNLPPRVAPGEPILRRRTHVEQGLIDLGQLSGDAAFRLRPEGDVARLATDIARLGQAFPVEVRVLEGDAFQLVCGFRRVAALRFLQRDKVLARIHRDLSDEDALLMALADALHALTPSSADLLALRDALEADGRLGVAARDMLAQALGQPGLAPESVEEEIDADELALATTASLADVNQDLALLVPVFAALEPDRRAELLQQLRYAAELVAYLEEER